MTDLSVKNENTGQWLTCMPVNLLLTQKDKCMPPGCVKCK